MENNQRYDSLGGIFTEVAATRQYGTALLSIARNGGARMAYAQGGLSARVVDLPADKATSTGVTVKGVGPELQAELDRLQVLPALSDALRWSLLDGGGALVMITRDPAPSMADELKPEALQTIEEFRVVSVVDMTAGDERYDDPKLRNFGMPTHYLVKWNGNREVRVHESRIIEIPGGPRAFDGIVTTLKNIPWAGAGLSPQALIAINRYRRTVELAEKLMERSQQAVHAMKGLAEMIMSGQEGAVRKRIDLVDGVRGALNGVAIDKEDSYTITNALNAGIKDTIDKAEIAVSAEVGIPVTILFGRSPGGLNASGDSDWATFLDQCDHYRKRRLSPALERIVALILSQSTVTFADVSDEWEVVWNGLEQLNKQQTAELDNKRADTTKKTAEAIKILQDTSALSQDEAHAYLEDQRMFGLVPAEDGDGRAGAARYAGQT
jgi:phage-related protein (TIGR01555 family)